MSAPTRPSRVADGAQLRVGKSRRELMNDAEIAVVDAEIAVIERPGDQDAVEALQAAEEALKQLYMRYRVPANRYTSAQAGLLVVDIERSHLPRGRSGLREVFEAELDDREAGLWEAIADEATRSVALD